MIMPANYSVIAENELSYVEGGAFHFYVDPISDGGEVLANNIVTWIGNAYTTKVLNTFIGTWFKKDQSDDAVGLSGNLKSNIKSLFQGQVQGDRWQDKLQYGVSNTIGVASAIWILGTQSVVKASSPSALSLSSTSLSSVLEGYQKALTASGSTGTVSIVYNV